MAPNLSALLKTNADDVKRPIPVPDGTYYGVIVKHEIVESGKKKTPGIQYTIRLTHAHEDVDLSSYEGEISGKEMRTTFWVSDNSLFMLKEFVESCGLVTEGRTLEELYPQVISQPVILDVVTKITEDGKGSYNQINSVKGAS